MERFRFLTAGESHGKALTAIIEGMVNGLPLPAEYIDGELRRRQAGYGRSSRMKIEEDKVEIISGLWHGLTTGSPIALLIYNKDWRDWEAESVSCPRPGMLTSLELLSMALAISDQLWSGPALEKQPLEWLLGR